MQINHQSIGAYQEALSNQRDFEMMAQEDAAFIPFAVSAAQRTLQIANTFTADTWEAYYEIGSRQAVV